MTSRYVAIQGAANSSISISIPIFNRIAFSLATWPNQQPRDKGGMVTCSPAHFA